jgi:serine/threonine protein phosphatase PrpC
MQKENIKGGTTALVSLFIEDKGYIANAGDSRAVLCKEGRAVRCTIDHKPDVPEEEKRIYDLGGNVTTSVDKLGRITSRVCGVLAVARALGDFSLAPYVSAEPQVHGPIDLAPENKNYFLIMACDGLWDKVTDEEAVAIVAPVEDVEQAATKLRDFAFQQGSDDNISVVVIRFPPFHPFTPKE